MTDLQRQSDDDYEERLSAAFDGESAEPVDLPDERQAQLDRDWSLLRQQLQALPVQSTDLVAAVRAELAEEESTQQIEPAARSGRVAWIPAVSVVATIAAVAVLAALPLLNQPDLSGQQFAQVDEIRRQVNRLVPDPEACRVVVVSVAADLSIEETVNEMLGAVEERGAAVTAVHSEVDESAEYSAGLLLTAGSEAQAILNALVDDPQQLEWNPAEVGGRSHEEIREMFLASVKVPTESDRVFGAMYVVNEDSLAVSLKQLPSDVAEPEIAVASADTDQPEFAAPAPAAVLRTAEGTSEASVGSPLPAGSPLIVIFRRQTADTDKQPLPEQGKLPNDGTLQPAV